MPGLHGTSQNDQYMVEMESFGTLCVQFRRISHMILSALGIVNRILCHGIPRKPLLPMISHGTNLDKENGQTIRGRRTTPPTRSQVSYRHPHSLNDKIRRASEQTSPQVARAVGPPGDGTRAADRTVAAVRSAVFYSGHGRGRGSGKGPRDSGSEFQRRVQPEG